MGSAFSELEDGVRGNAMGSEVACRAGGSDEVEAQFVEACRCRQHSRFVLIVDADKDRSLGWKFVARRRLALGKGDPEARPNSHDLSGGFHFRSQQDIHPGEAGKGEDRFLDGKMFRFDFPVEPQFLQGLAQHDLGGELGQRAADGLAHKGNGARGPRVHLENVDLTALDGELHVHQANHPQFGGHESSLPFDLLLDLFRDADGRQHAGAVSRMNPGLFDMFHDPADHRQAAVADGINVQLDGILEKLIDEDGMTG